MDIPVSSIFLKRLATFCKTWASGKLFPPILWPKPMIHNDIHRVQSRPDTSTFIANVVRVVCDVRGSDFLGVLGCHWDNLNIR